jgi:hypothetical protein
LEYAECPEVRQIDGLNELLDELLDDDPIDLAKTISWKNISECS